MRYPSRVAGLIAIATPPPASEDWQGANRAERMARMTTEEQAFFEEQRSRRHSGEPISPEDEQRWANLSWRVDFADPIVAKQQFPLFDFPANYEVNRALNAEMDRWDATGDILPHLALIEAPALLVHGARDPRPPAVSVADALPHAELVVIPDAGHFPWIEQPDDVANVLRRFLQAGTYVDNIDTP
jgi:proline iminopeptidase